MEVGGGASGHTKRGCFSCHIVSTRRGGVARKRDTGIIVFVLVLGRIMVWVDDCYLWCGCRSLDGLGWLGGCQHRDRSTTWCSCCCGWWWDVMTSTDPIATFCWLGRRNEPPCSCDQQQYDDDPHHFLPYESRPEQY
eukprot:scaffold24720_cov33-Attheya_sp.AAC.2